MKNHQKIVKKSRFFKNRQKSPNFGKISDPRPDIFDTRAQKFRKFVQFSQISQTSQKKFYKNL